MKKITTKAVTVPKIINSHSLETDWSSSPAFANSKYDLSETQIPYLLSEKTYVNIINNNKDNWFVFIK